MTGDKCPECGETLEYASAEQVEKLSGEKCGSCGNVLDCCGVEMAVSFSPENTLICYMCNEEIKV